MWRSSASSKYYKRANAELKRFKRAHQEAPYINPNRRTSDRSDNVNLSEVFREGLTLSVGYQSEALAAPTSSEEESNEASAPLNVLELQSSSSEDDTTALTPVPLNVLESQSTSAETSVLCEAQTINFSLTKWALQHGIRHVAMNDLLKILKPYHHTLPLDSRTLLRTPKKISSIRDVYPGQYYHFGIQEAIRNLLSKTVLKNNSIELLVNIDGLNISDSSSSQLYPILISIFEHNAVDVAGVYHGLEKPKDANEFLSDFVSEIINIINNGFVFNNVEYSVKIKAFVCDVPAKSFIKFTKGHTGYFSCSKCFTEGEYVNNNVCFPDLDFVLRTDEQFRNKVNEDHHTGTSILESIPGLDMIKSFALDPMHLLYLGVMKRLLVNLWVNGKPPIKLSFRQINAITESLVLQRTNIPSEFSRKPRSLNESKRWKATEYSQFLFYTGPVCLKDIFSTDQYVHFLSLHAALTMLSTADLSKAEYAEELLKWFVESFSDLYGSEYISHNIHNLLHLADDVRSFGPLYTFSAFKFENFMRTFKKCLRKNEKPLQQIIKRKEEIDKFDQESQSCSNQHISYPVFKKRHGEGGVISNQNYISNEQFSEVLFKDFKLSIMAPDNCCSLKDGSIVVIKNFVKVESEYFIVGTKYQRKQNFYHKPCESSLLSIYVVEEESDLKMWNVNEIIFKFVKLSYQTMEVVFPLLHTIC
ncbi:unnamed protein product [Ceutorhynchus assimilis]|uniref:Transposase domain-containing protein n=1 Tax=Ceutorhynchus assimilis TaxID=467358 RepID=A0A9N9MIL6_9CUCU|nr:unnamed protein product [Ceutorhynchus assimilis]